MSNDNDDQLVHKHETKIQILREIKRSHIQHSISRILIFETFYSSITIEQCKFVMLLNKIGFKLPKTRIIQ